MGISKTYTAQISGLGAGIIIIEADISNGLHAFSIVGLGDRAVAESKDRVAAAIKNSGYVSPKQKNQKVVISLAPADLKKEGSAFELGMAIAYLSATGDINFKAERKLFLGELSLEGKIRAINGTLAMTQAAKREGFEEIYVPIENAREASLIPDIKIFPVERLLQVIDHLSEKGSPLEYFSKTSHEIISETIQHRKKLEVPDFSDIFGQENAKRALEIAAIGKHNILMYGPPGTGKTMLAKALEGILLPLSYEESLEVTLIHSVTDNFNSGIIVQPPFRSPHHTSSYASIIGGGNKIHPGEITLAHKGILFMDEFPEFDRRVINALRQPLEDGKVNIARIKGSVEYPAQCLLVAAMNPCPCGNLHNESKMKQCICTDGEISSYQKKISGPIADRIDLWVPVLKVEHDRFNQAAKENGSSLAIRKRVMKAYEFRKERTDADETDDESEKISGEALALLNSSSKKLGFSGRGYQRTIAVARTIADIAESEEIKKSHILEALQYRQRN